MRLPAALIALYLSLSTMAHADVRLPKVLGSQMVLQRNSTVKIWGWADPGEDIRVGGSWFDRTVQTKANNQGHWLVKIKTRRAGGPHRLTIEGKNRIQLQGILFGEVWIGSGQSNMEMPLVRVSGAYTGIKDAAKEVASAKYPQIRLFQVGNFSSKEPLDDVKHGIQMYGIPKAKCRWQACTPKTIPTFASTAYFFAREIHTRLKVPVGIIDASWGGTPAEAWTPIDGLKKLSEKAAVKLAMTAGQNPRGKIPSRLYNGMIHPLRNLSVKGFIWYQGEGNAGKANRYRKLFTTMITQWRTAFGDAELPFYFVQISPFNYRGVNSAYLREAQLQTLSLKNTGMAVTMDIGNLRDIHPKNKQEVGRRLALWALAKDYNQKLLHSGPIYRQAKVDGAKVIISFDFADSGLATRDGKPPSHFKIAARDMKFVPAVARIAGNRVVVSSPKVSAPVAVRYAFDNRAMPNLMNKAGLPASSFRTDK